ncbi:ABC transporter permease [Blastopirellula sp. J2-11]|uniref:ABC transporter permease n=1 Tax=Blastopirellula sp. J2-11 TaxID=2943192 RepID=UPI0021C9B104|nr:ABC transporter permease [Blastopirellula sp. J2-11]UUO04585.1 ABC transporter permease [Blastopirellula sp. J2-11]
MTSTIPEVSSIADSPEARGTVAFAEPTLVITSDGSGNRLNLWELWRYRHVLRHMVLRDLSVRYKETVVGVLWAILQPLGMMVIFTLVFGRRGQELHSGDIPYPVSVFLALSIWQFVSVSISRGADSIISNASIISKIYFCRLVLPLTPIVVNLVDFTIRIGLLAILMLIFGVVPSINVLLAPLLVVIMILVTTSITFWLSALTAVYRDVQQVVPFIVQAWFFLSPVFYDPVDVIPKDWLWLYYLNPIAGLISGFRWVVFGDGSAPWTALAITTISSTLLFFSGTYVFRRVERNVVDIL